jgi:hypothetical protein
VFFDAEHGSRNVVAERHRTDTVEHDDRVAGRIEKSDELIGQTPLFDGRGAIDGSADVASDVAADSNWLRGDLHPHRLTIGSAESKFNDERRRCFLRLFPRSFACLPFVRLRVHPRSSSRHDSSATQNERTKSIVPTSETTIGVRLEDANRQGGGCGVDGPSFAGSPRWAVE